MTDGPLEFTVERNATPASDEVRASILANPGFGQFHTDHMVSIDYIEGKGWHDARVMPYGPIELDPSAVVLHYAQEIFEGLKGYRHADGSVWTFRPERNAARFQKSAERLALPQLPTDLFVESLRQLGTVDRDWVPDPEGEKSLYLRPFMFASEQFLGVRSAQEVKFVLIASPHVVALGLAQSIGYLRTMRPSMSSKISSRVCPVMVRPWLRWPTTARDGSGARRTSSATASASSTVPHG